MALHRVAKYFGILAIWCVSAAVATTFSYASWLKAGMDADWSLIARRQFATYLIWGALLAPAVLWLCRRYPIDRTNWRRNVPVHIAGALSVAAVHALFRTALDPYTYPDQRHERSWNLVQGYFFANSINDLWMYGLFAGLAFSMAYYRKFRDRELQAEMLQTQLARAELQMLKMQLQPHFLFNTLHSISTLMHRDIAAADRMLSQLSDLLRITLDSSAQQTVTLKRELDFVSGYLEIEKTRFQDRLTVNTEIDPELLDVPVPLLLLQPLVENAVRHGIARRSGAGQIDILAARCGGDLKVSVINDSPGRDGLPGTHGVGIGLANTVARLKHLYGDAYRFRINGYSNGRFRVDVEIPIAAAGTLTPEARVPLATAS